MTTQDYINQNKTETFKKGDTVTMHSCYEATLEKYENKLWVCQTDSYLDRSNQEVVFLHDYSGCFAVKFLRLIK